MSMDTLPVFVIDDDEAIRELLTDLFESVNIASECYASADQFLECFQGRPGCIVVDVRMRGMSGLKLQDILSEQGYQNPIIFITGHGDIPMALRAMKAGAFDFFTKPFNNQELLEAVEKGLAQAQRLQEEHQNKRIIQQRFANLTKRERHVLNYLTEGHPNKVIAGKLCISLRTVEAHRASLMRKLQVKSIAELVKLAIMEQH